jgi:hypothetical protein
MARKACPVVEGQRPAPQTRITRDWIVLVDVSQDRIIVHLAIGEPLSRADELLRADTLAQCAAAHERCPYAWFKALRRLDADDPFAADQLRRYGYLPN